MTPKKLILKCSLCPGDIVMLTAAVRDLHDSYPGEYLTDARTPCPALWQNNPRITPIADDDPEAEVVEMHYPLISRSNQAPHHFLHGYRQFLEEKLGRGIRQGAFKGDIHLSTEERSWKSQVEEIEGDGARFWIIVSGGKNDFTAKLWEPARWQSVVDHFAGQIRFVQVGESGHNHPPLRGVLDLRGKTDLRQLVRLVHHADGVLCGVTSLMHLAAAVPVREGRTPLRPCVVVAGGREPAHWEAYVGHRFIDTIGALPCCASGGCWKSRVAPLGDGDEKDKSLCEHPVRAGGGYLPQCMDLITPEQVIAAIESYSPKTKPKEAVVAPAEPAATEVHYFKYGHKPVTGPWGPALWQKLHSGAAKLTDAAERAALVKEITAALPCGDCKTHWASLLTDLPPATGSAREFFEWSVEAHNRVRRRMGQKEMPLRDAEGLYGFQKPLPPAPTLLSEDRRTSLLRAAKSAPPGCGAEVGVFRGGSLRLIASAVSDRVYGFDTFAGLPAEKWSPGDRHTAGEFAASFEQVSAALSDLNNVTLIRGVFPESAAHLAAERFSIVHIDIDFYECAREAIAFFWPRMVEGGMIVFDDWDNPNTPGIRRAIEEAGLAIQITAPWQCMAVKEPVDPKPPTLGVVLGTFGSVPYVHLGLESLRRFHPGTPVLVIDDFSPDRERLQQLCLEYGATLKVRERRFGHVSGDLRVFIEGLAWAAEQGIDILVKFSRRWVPTAPWIDALAILHQEAQSPTYSARCLGNGFGFRSEAVAMHVQTWLKTDALKPIREAAVAAELRFVLAEQFVHHGASIAFQRRPMTTRKYESLHPHHQGCGGYVRWPLLGESRHVRQKDILWHESTPVADYHKTLMDWGITKYSLVDLIPNRAISKKSILVQRAGALGDVICTTPILRELRKRNPDAVIEVATNASHALSNNPDINGCIRADAPTGGYNEVFDLNLAYEKEPKQHIVSAYCKRAFGELLDDVSLTLVTSLRDKERAAAIISKKTISLHCAVSWRNRTLPEATWRQVVEGILAMGFEVVLLGTVKDIGFSLDGVKDLRGKLTIQETRSVIDLCLAFVGSDSGLMHVAGATATPLLGVFTSAEAQYRLSQRDRVASVHTLLECHGCLHRAKPPVTSIECERGDFACVDEIPASRILEALKELIA